MLREVYSCVCVWRESGKREREMKSERHQKREREREIEKRKKRREKKKKVATDFIGRERNRHIDRQTDRQTDRKAERQREREREGGWGRETLKTRKKEKQTRLITSDLLTDLELTKARENKQYILLKI